MIQKDETDIIQNKTQIIIIMHIKCLSLGNMQKKMVHNIFYQLSLVMVIYKKKIL